MKVIVKTNKKEFKITSYDKDTDTYTVELKSRPIDSKANTELIKLLSKSLKKKLKIISGHTSKIKILKEIDD